MQNIDTLQFESYTIDRGTCVGQTYLIPLLKTLRDLANILTEEEQGEYINEWARDIGKQLRAKAATDKVELTEEFCRANIEDIVASGGGSTGSTESLPYAVAQLEIALAKKLELEAKLVKANSLPQHEQIPIITGFLPAFLENKAEVDSWTNEVEARKQIAKEKRAAAKERKAAKEAMATA